jgi:RND superfamily putative drug exporter
VVFQAKTGSLNDPAPKAAVTQTITNLKAIPGVSSVTSPYDPTPTAVTFDEGKPDVKTANLNITPSGNVGYAAVSFSSPITSPDQAKTWFDQLTTAAQPAVDAGLGVTFGGAVADQGNPAPPGISAYSSLIGIAAAIVILLIAMRSAVSMAVPIGVAICSVIVSGTLSKILEASFTVGSVGPILGDMIGLAVCIDYSLFIVTRYRQGLDDGMEPYDAVGRAIATSGSAVLFAGVAVCLALCGLFIVGIPYITQIGFVAAMYVVVSILAALTLVPALLGALGHRINAGRILHREPKPVEQTVGGRWAGVTARHTGIVAAASLIALVILILPVKSLELGLPDDGNVQPSLTQYQAFQLVNENFGAGQNGSLLLAIDLPPVNSTNVLPVLQAFGTLQTAVAAAPDVARVSLPIPNSIPSSTDPSAVPTAAIMQVVPSVAPNSQQAADLVRNLRTNVIPDALKGSALNPDQVYVGGQTAINIDLTDALQAKLPIYILAVVATAFLLLMMVFRSIFVPATASIMNLLSIGAAYGVLVVVFQWGWGKGAIGLSSTLPIVPFVPVMMFAVLFGLSMDYEVFLISRIREDYNKSGDSRASVREGLSTVARVIVVAALIMMSVFVSFVPNPDPQIKMIGFGLTVAVLIDVSIVRMMLVPASMQLWPKANWWFPKWLDKILPRINVD